MISNSRYLIAEAGATGIDWFLFDRKEILSQLQTEGLNPETMLAEGLLTRIGGEVSHWLLGQIPAQTWYYGAGLGNAAYRSLLLDWLRQLLPGTVAETHHDLLAACRATCGDAPGLVAILGTGSIAARWDGKEIAERRGGHGWLFGDEASGADLGKRLIKAGLDGQLPTEIVERLEAFAGMELLEIRRTVYQAEKPGAEMARFAKFVGQERNVPAVLALVEKAMGDFVTETLVPLALAGLAAHFVGSVAAAFEGELRAACQKAALPIVSILPRPGAQLVLWHQARLGYT